MHRSLPLAAAALAATLSLAATSACGMGPYNAEARDTWSRTYTLSKTGEVSISNVNGRVELEGVDGSTVEVKAERIARAATEQLAKELLPRIPINDRSTPDLVSVETGRMNGILIGANFTVEYHVKVPNTAMVRATTVNGGVNVRSLGGRTVVRSTNGGVAAENMTGSLEARTVNGGVRVQFAALGSHDVTLTTVNGGIRVSLPQNAKATVEAKWVNGGFDSSGLKFDVRDSGKRRFEGLLNGGGTSINMTTVNGGVRIGTSLGADAEGDQEKQKTRVDVAP